MCSSRTKKSSAYYTARYYTRQETSDSRQPKNTATSQNNTTTNNNNNVEITGYLFTPLTLLLLRQHLLRHWVHGQLSVRTPSRALGQLARVNAETALHQQQKAEGVSQRPADVVRKNEQQELKGAMYLYCTRLLVSCLNKTASSCTWYHIIHTSQAETETGLLRVGYFRGGRRLRSGNLRLRMYALLLRSLRRSLLMVTIIINKPVPVAATIPPYGDNYNK